MTGNATLLSNLIKGDKGDQGDAGATGATGSTGSTGPAGADGADGVDGAVSTRQVVAETGSPYLPFFETDFTVDDSGFLNFNGGTHTYDATEDEIIVTAGGPTRGVMPPADAEHEASTDYVLRISIEIVDVPVKILSKYNDLLLEVSSSGDYEVTYTSSATGGGFGNRLIIASDGGSGSFKISNFQVVTPNPQRVTRTKAEADASYLATTDSILLFAKDFSDPNENLTYVANYNTTSYGISSSQLRGTAGSGGHLIAFEYGELGGADAVEFVDIEIDVEIVSSVSLKVHPIWSGSGTDRVISTSGLHTFRLHREGTQGNAELNKLLVGTTGDAGEIRINSIKVSTAIEDFTKTRQVLIGYGAENTYSGTGENLGIVAGYLASSNQLTPTVIGNEATLNHEQVYGSNGPFGCASGDEGCIVGDESAGGGWRTTAHGAKAKALGQSASAFGAGAVALSAHGVAFGRGAYVPDEALMPSVGTVIAGNEIYLENGWGHKFNTPLSGLSIGDQTPSTTTKTVHGQDAFDARYPAWDSGTTYADPGTDSTAADIVQNTTGGVYKSIAASTDVEPGVDSGWETYWHYLYDVPTAGAGSGVASDFDVDGGHVRLASGRSTGSGTGGTAGLQITDGTDNGENVKQTLVDGFAVDSDYGGEETPMIVRTSDGRQLRIAVGADDSAGTGYRTLRIAN